MVYVTAGSSEFDFSRLFREVDRLLNLGILDDVMAQIGSTHYEPKQCTHQRYISKDEVHDYIRRSEFIISHAGCATLNECLGLRKKLILAPRQVRFKEAPDDHQMEITNILSAANKALVVYEINELSSKVQEVTTWQPHFDRPISSDLMVEHINTFLERAFPWAKAREF